MTQDARFQDGVEKPLYIGAIDPADIEVMSAFLQDAVVPVSEMKWRKQHRQLAVLLNRFRWEDKDHPCPIKRVKAPRKMFNLHFLALQRSKYKFRRLRYRFAMSPNLISRPRVTYLLIAFKPVLGLRLGLRVANCYAKVGAQNASFSRHSRRRF